MRQKWRKEQIAALLVRLEAAYGQPTFLPVFHALDELVSCILSQHTSDRTSYPAFVKLRRELPTWAAVLDAGAERLADVIRGAGLANNKSKAICGCLAEIHRRNGDFTLEPLRSMPLLEARSWLASLPGVGLKTASIVLCFSFGKGATPVDTHVFRVGCRLGFLDEKAGEKKAHDVLLAIVPEPLAARFHVALLAHGRAICRAPKPNCEICPLTDCCRYYKLQSRVLAKKGK